MHVHTGRHVGAQERAQPWRATPWHQKIARQRTTSYPMLLRVGRELCILNFQKPYTKAAEPPLQLQVDYSYDTITTPSTTSLHMHDWEAVAKSIVHGSLESFAILAELLLTLQPLHTPKGIASPHIPNNSDCCPCQT